MDQSFPEDNPQHPLHSHHLPVVATSIDGDFLNNSIVQDRSSGLPSVDVVDVDRHIEMEQQDERIEGLEATVAKMQRALKVLGNSLSMALQSELNNDPHHLDLANGAEAEARRRAVSREESFEKQ